MKNPMRELLREYNAVIKETDAVYGRFARASGLSDAAFWLLYAIWDMEGPCTQQDVSRQWTMSKQTVNSAMKGLAAKGLIRLDPEGKRAKRIFLTDEGAAFAARYVAPVFAAEEQALLRMSDEERSAMMDANRRYLALLRQEAGG